jgi:hypothetical protein
MQARVSESLLVLSLVGTWVQGCGSLPPDPPSSTWFTGAKDPCSVTWTDAEDRSEYNPMNDPGFPTDIATLRPLCHPCTPAVDPLPIGPPLRKDERSEGAERSAS